MRRHTCYLNKYGQCTFPIPLNTATPQMALTPAPRHCLPPELHDYILDYQSADKQVLSVCALVCRAWCATSQFHLFDTVVITHTAPLPAFVAFLEQGDEVIMFEPFFDQYLPSVTFNGGVPVYVPLHPDMSKPNITSNDWTIDFEELRCVVSKFVIQRSEYLV